MSLSYPIYAISPGGEFGLGLDFMSLAKDGGYGYTGFHAVISGTRNNQDFSVSASQGIVRVNLKNGQNELILSIAKIENENKLKHNSLSYIPHILFNPSGTRICFLHRFRLLDGGIHTRLLTANPDGSDLSLLAEGTLSHFNWVSDDEIFVWGRNRQLLTNLRKRNFFQNPFVKPLLNFIRKKERGFLRHHIIGDQLLLFKDKEGYTGSIGVGSITEDGHFTRNQKYQDWILGDNYPDKEHHRDLFLYNRKENKKVNLKRFYSMPNQEYIKKENLENWDLSVMRSDLHPRWNRDGTQICFDSVHEGTRQVYVLNVKEL